MMRFFLLLLLGILSLGAAEVRLKVGGVERTALVVLPAKPEGAPIVMVFHGHGGTAGHARRAFHIESLWPEAIVVYPQGLPTKGQITDPKGERTGWQGSIGLEGDRDLHFFDALLAHLAQYRPGALFVTGHSNGGSFSYQLLAARPGAMAAIAPSAAVLGKDSSKLSPKPILHLGGTGDPLVKWAWQKRMITHVQRLNSCVQKGVQLDEYTTCYESPKGTPVETFIHSGGHTFPDTAPAAIVRFFKRVAAGK